MDVHHRPAELLQRLIRFDTTNPPGNEIGCITFINDLLSEAGIATQIFARSAERPNLVARLPGQGQRSPLLLYGHVDVVTTEQQRWTHPPFGGNVSGGFVWGRGALDMKGGVAMMLAAFVRAKVEAATLPGDVVLALVSDEEGGGTFGAKYLVDDHPEQFAGIRYALGEVGGFALTIRNQRFYPIQVAEKQICSVKATLRGAGGHGSIPVRRGAMAKLGQLLHDLDMHRLAVHVTPVVRQMIDTIGAALGGADGAVLHQLLDPRLTDGALDAMGEGGRIFDPLLHHTVSPTVLRGSQKRNVIPSEVSVELDGRVLPGFRPADLLADLRHITDEQVEFEVMHHDPGPAEPDMGLFEMLAGVLREADPTGVPVPLLSSMATDGRFFSRLGIQTYGFLPMPLPADFNWTDVIHAADERVPVDAVDFGAHAIYQALQR